MAQIKLAVERKVQSLPPEIGVQLQKVLNGVVLLQAGKQTINSPMIDKEAFTNWADKVTTTDYKARHEFMQAGELPDFVMQDESVKALNPFDNAIHISDHQLRHSLREVKSSVSKSLPLEVIKQLPDKLENARWFYDSKQSNLLAVFDVNDGGNVGKSVIAINFKKGNKLFNAIVTSGVKPRLF